MSEMDEPKWLDDDDDLSAQELEYFRARLTEEQGLITERLRAHRNAVTQAGEASTGDSVDIATQMSEYNYSVQRIEQDERRLREINAALAKFGSHDYGICEGTGELIRRRRLRSRPWVRYSLEYQEELELEQSRARRLGSS
ncbi:MAG: hypothetical protein AAGI01_05260 [Myxococcota bacterium]